MDICNFMERYLLYLTRTIDGLSSELSQLPEGTLQCFRNGDSFSYWNKTPGKPRTYIPKNDVELRTQLANKCVKEACLHDYAVMQSACENFLQVLKENPANKMEEVLAHQGVGRYLKQTSEDEELQHWIDEPYEKNEKFPEHLTVTAVTGEKVRSKSEAMCIMLLCAEKIPYHYEEKHLILGQNFYPDFTVVRPRDRKKFIIEIFGMMDDYAYAQKAYKKLDLYAAAGYIPDENLICFFETRKSPLDASYMECMLRHFLR